jgi:hypothetical protein
LKKQRELGTFDAERIASGGGPGVEDFGAIMEKCKNRAELHVGVPKK